MSFYSGSSLQRDAHSLFDGNAGEKVRAFLGMCTPFLEPGFDRDTLLNGDETTIFIDPTAATFALIGSRRVEVITSGQQKTRQEFRCAIRNWPKVKTSHFVAEKKHIEKLGATLSR